MISDRHVLISSIPTVDSRQFSHFEVVVGLHNLYLLEGASRHRILKITRHPDFAQEDLQIPIRDSGDNIKYVVFPRYSFDFTILHLLKPVEIGPKIAPVCLPSPTLNDEFLNGKNLEVSGWGFKNQLGLTNLTDDSLHSTTVVGIKNEQCSNEFKIFLQLVNSDKDFDLISESMLCTAHPDRGTCPGWGDRGGILQ